MPTRKKQPTVIYQLKVTLKNSKPLIWRQIQVTGDTNLSTLHIILQIVMGWSDSHLHQFQVGQVYYGIPDPQFDFDGENENQFSLSQVAAAAKKKFL